MWISLPAHLQQHWGFDCTGVDFYAGNNNARLVGNLQRTLGTDCSAPALSETVPGRLAQIGSGSGHHRQPACLLGNQWQVQKLRCPHALLDFHADGSLNIH